MSQQVETQVTRPVGSPRRTWGAPAVAALVLGVVGAAVLLALAFLGWYARPAADDYCFTTRVRDWGALDFVTSFWTRENGRILNGAVLAPLYVRPHYTLRLFALVLGVLTLAMLYLALRRLLRLYGMSVPAVLVAAAAAVVGATAYGSTTNTYQSLLWAPGAVTHTIPPLLALGALGVLLPWNADRTWRRGLVLPPLALAVTGFLLALMSETMAMVAMATVTAVVLLQAAVLRGLDRTTARLAAFALGSAVGLGTLLVSPGSRNRRSSFGVADRLGLDTLGDVVRGTAVLLGEALTRPSTWGLVLTGIVVALAARGRSAAPALVGRQRVLLALLPALVVLASCAATVIALYLGYGPAGYLKGRAHGNFYFLFCLAALAYGLLLGRLLPARATAETGTETGATARSRLHSLVPVGLAVAALLCMLPLVQRAVDTRQVVVTRAAAWDAQDVRVRAEVAAGQTQPVVAPLRIARLLMPYDRREKRDVVRGCVTSFYGAQRIVPPGKQ